MKPLKLIDKLDPPTPHNEAKLGDFAETVLMPGDPMVAKYIAENYLNDTILINNVRNIHGYTGTYKNKKVSIMASGIGQPSIAIYSYELFTAYNVKNIIRIGTMGGLNKNVKIGDLVVAMACSTDSSFYNQFNVDGSYSPCCNPTLLHLMFKNLAKEKMRFFVGNVFSTDRFYSPIDNSEKWEAMNVLGEDMEAASLYCNAAFLKRRAISLNIVSNSIHQTKTKRKPVTRIFSFKNMLHVALETAYAAYDIEKNLGAMKGYYTEG